MTFFMALSGGLILRNFLFHLGHFSSTLENFSFSNPSLTRAFIKNIIDIRPFIKI